MKLSLFLIPILVWVNYSDISPDSIPIKWPSDNCFIRSARLPISPTAEAFIPISGKYSWSFKIPLMGTQVMTYAFSGQTIDVTMTGSVLDRAYKLSVISFDQVNPSCAYADEILRRLEVSGGCSSILCTTDFLTNGYFL